MRPKIIVHMMSSVDGRLYIDRYSKQFNGKSIEEVLDHYWTVSGEFGADAIMMGRTTLQESYPLKTFEHKNTSPTQRPETFKAQPVVVDAIPNIVIDTKGKVLYEGNKEQNFITILSEQVSDEYLAHLRENNVSYLFAGADGKDLDKAMEILSVEFGLKTILLEGGGYINGSFLKAGLIDELSLMVYPSIDGLSGMPSIFEYKGQSGENPSEGQSLEFISSKQIEDGIVWLQYKFHKA